MLKPQPRVEAAQRGVMKKIETITIYGLGALGMLFGSRLQKAYGEDRVKFVMDSERYARHKNDRYTINDEPFAFSMQDVAEVKEPSDLVIIAVKGPALPAVIPMIQPSVGEETVIISLMNGISSEDMLAERYDRRQILDCISIGMDAMRDGTDLHYTKMGKIQIGSRNGDQKEQVEAVATALREADVPYEVMEDIRTAMWHKYLINVGVNQSCTAYETDYGHITSPGPIRDEMKEAMREVIRVAAAEGVTLSEKDIDEAIALEKTLKPEGYPSMRQDAIAGRTTEVDLFAGTVIALGKKYGIPTPVNEKYRRMILCD
jgi:2-dehydropantoate 2-reductase